MEVVTDQSVLVVGRRGSARSEALFEAPTQSGEWLKPRWSAAVNDRRFSRAAPAGRRVGNEPWAALRQACASGSRAGADEQRQPKA